MGVGDDTGFFLVGVFVGAYDGIDDVIITILGRADGNITSLGLVLDSIVGDLLG